MSDLKNSRSTVATKKTSSNKGAAHSASVSENRKLSSRVSQLETENSQLRGRIADLENFNQEVMTKYNNVQALKPFQAELIQMQKSLEARGKKMIIIFEGRGGAGKGGTIARITQYMNAKNYRVVAMGKPTEEERTQWYFQKYVEQFPRAGKIVLFDRSWYQRAIIEPVFGFCSDEEYENFMEGVVGFEKDLARQGIILIKFYFSVSRQEQSRRFEERKEDPLQNWKLDEIDLDAEEFRDEFTEAKYEMLKKTHTMHAPWTIIRSDNKFLARLNAMKYILSMVDYEPINPELDLQIDHDVVLSGAYELERMKAQRIRMGIST